jgi:hypothetical protein
MKKDHETPCCSGDWGWKKKVFIPVKRRIADGVPAVDTVGNFLGCQTNMITGQAGCMAGGRFYKKRTEEAKRRLNKFLFVGLIDHWDLSVCLYNYITTGERLIRASQLYNNNPTSGTQMSGYNRSEVPDDHADSEVYAAAVDRFRRDIAKHNITKDNCKMSVDT